jgi:nitrogen fixation NifU-like protein
MADLSSLYQEAILDHYKKPRNFRRPAGANRQADGINSLCGDNLNIYIRIENGIVMDIGFMGSGCALAIASASMMTESLMGKTKAEAIRLFELFDQMLTHRSNPQPDPPELGKLTVFSGVCEYPVRAKCATLAWHAMRAALEDEKTLEVSAPNR